MPLWPFIHLPFSTESNLNQIAYQDREKRRRNLVMGRFVFVSIQHKKCEHSTCEADTQLPKKENDISKDIHFSYPQNIVHYQSRRNWWSSEEPFASYCNLHNTKKQTSTDSDAVRFLLIKLAYRSHLFGFFN